MPQEHLTLQQLNQNIKDQLSKAFPTSYWVIAEISEIRTVRSGHCYLELIEKDQQSDQILAKARATIWAFTYRMLKPYFETTTKQPLTSGLKILVKVSVEFQEVYGFSLNIKDIDPTFTLGDIARRRMEIIQQLEDEGIMEMNKETLLSALPQQLAIISSPTAAGYEDFIKQLSNNSDGFVFYHHLFPAIMQGEEAEASIITALEKIYEHEDKFDAVVLIRGGGSTADLMCFDSYLLALNIAQFPLPVLTGIGHERDESVADMVAHTRLKTPTAVAEFLINRLGHAADYLLDLQDEFVDGTKQLIIKETHRLELAAHKFSPVVTKILANQRRQHAEAANRLSFSIKNYFDKQFRNFSHVKESMHYLCKKQVRSAQQKSEFISTRLQMEVNAYMNNKQQQLLLMDKTAKLSDPIHILKKGYSITSHEGKVLKDLQTVQNGDAITTLTQDGNIISRIEKINRKK